ncbi:MAG: hypothetical protein IJR29_00640 [Butyrivibrio sp.]|nr:hypothetical protein [Butyrivibrio sp.]
MPAKKKNAKASSQAVTAEKDTVVSVAKEEVKKPAVKKVTKTEAKKPAVKKTEETKAVKKPVEKEEVKAEVKANIVLQYADKNVTFDTLVENAQNVCIYDMGKKAEDIKKLDLYVKPEENTVYFVLNDEEHNQYGL